MASTLDQLRAKALLALEEALQETRYRPVPRTFALRFALAYLWSLRGGDRAAYDDFWRAIAREDGMFRFGSADHALGWIYQHQRVERDNELAMSMWRRRQEAEKRSAAE